jgi:hypothetical protein
VDITLGAGLSRDKKNQGGRRAYGSQPKQSARAKFQKR